MKEMKSYIHLYIGCKIRWVRSDGNFVVQDLTLSDASWLKERTDAKLILRPLSSMTDEEKKELVYIWKPVMNENVYGALRTKYMLDKGLDLFELKEAGLAVYEE